MTRYGIDPCARSAENRLMHRNNSSEFVIKLGLQGGGAHGAFTWGVLDRVLQVPGLQISAVSGTSSGAMNAAALVQGWQRGGAEGARAALAEFWEAVAKHNAMADWWAAGARAWSDSAWFKPTVSPLSFNAMRPLVEGSFDIDALRSSPVALHVAATRVRDGALVMFQGDRLSHEALLASSCLPQWFPAVEIDGEAYWDGGFAGNPAIEPLLAAPGDALLCVLVQPLQLGQVPRQSSDILDVSAQLAFGTAFRRELRDLAMARQRADQRFLPSPRERTLRRLQLQIIAPDDGLGALGHAATDTRLHQLHALRERGYATADAWWQQHGKTFGEAGGDAARWADQFIG
jgi:NTE family protein